MKKFIIILLTILMITAITNMAQNEGRVYLTGSLDDVSKNPVFSPDGNYLAYTKAGYNGIFIYDINNKSFFQLTDEPSAGFAFKWSSDSKHILTRTSRYENLRRYNSVKVFNVVTGEPNQLSAESANMPYLPEWLPGNNLVLLPGQESVDYFETGIGSNYSENEKPIVVYSFYDRIVVRNISKSSETTLQPLNNQQYLNVTLSPDRSKIVFEVYGGNMFVMNEDGSQLTDLGIGYNPKWTFDSKQIVFMITEDDGHNFTFSDIYLINSDGSNKRNITNTKDVIELNPSISPDGRTLAYESYTDGAIYLMNLD